MTVGKCLHDCTAELKEHEHHIFQPLAFLSTLLEFPENTHTTHPAAVLNAASILISALVHTVLGDCRTGHAGQHAVDFTAPPERVFGSRHSLATNARRSIRVHRQC
jgi:hypothetical protein